MCGFAASTFALIDPAPSPPDAMLEPTKELRALEEARREQREFDAATNRLAIALASEGASFPRAQLAALERNKGKTAAGAGGKPFVSSPAGSRPGIAHRYVAASGARKAA